MAQWKGQFSGRTHATKVKSLERTLTVAVSALQVASEDDAQRRLKAARNIAQRLLSARLHMMRARISMAREKQEDSGVGTLRSREAAAQAGGVDAILREFGVTSNRDDKPNKALQATREDARA
jgi:hypothetical protein